MKTDGSGAADPHRSSTPEEEIEHLSRLAELRREGLLTDDEFAAKKRQILGEPIEHRRPRSRRTKLAIGAALGVLLLGGGGTALALKLSHDHKREAAARAAKDRAEARAHAKAVAAKREEARQQAAERAQRAEDRTEVSIRRLIVKDLQKSVTKDFNGRVSDGYLDGPILQTSCDPVGGGITDLDVKTGKFECLVATEDLGGGQMRGYPVDATINFTKGSYTWKMSS